MTATPSLSATTSPNGSALAPSTGVLPHLNALTLSLMTQEQKDKYVQDQLGLLAGVTKRTLEEPTLPLQRKRSNVGLEDQGKAPPLPTTVVAVRGKFPGVP